MADAAIDEEATLKGADALAQASGPRKSFARRILPYITGGIVSIGLGLGAGIVQRNHHGPARGESGEKKPPVTLDQFPVETKLELPKQIFNCADTGQNVAGTVNIQLEVRTTAEWGLPADKCRLKRLIDPKEDGKYYGRIRDALVMLLSTKFSPDLKTARGKEVLKLEILDTMNKILFAGSDPREDPQGIVTSVLFTDFLVQ